MNQDFLDLLRAFIDREVRFLIVGAYALGVHGRPRATGDLDVWVDTTPDNAARVLEALEAFGAPLWMSSDETPSSGTSGPRAARGILATSRCWVADLTLARLARGGGVQRVTSRRG